MDNLKRYYAIGFLLFFRLGCLFGIGLGLYSAYQEFQIYRNGVTIQAEFKEGISSVHTTTDRQGNLVSYEVQLFYEVEGRQYITQTSVKEGEYRRLKKGQVKEMKALASDPQRVSVAPKAIVIFSLFFSLIAGAFLLFSVWLGRKIIVRTTHA